MSLHLTPRLRVAIGAAAALVAALALVLGNMSAHVQTATASTHSTPFCATRAQLCTETRQPWGLDGAYTGHDEPSLLFYSNTAGSGNSNVYKLTLPTDPPAAGANQTISGPSYNFQLHPAFWFGMALCDSQSAPLPGAPCAADSDTNIYTSTDPTSPNYIGNHPGTGFMEMQFYPPGWSAWPAGVSCSPTQWCAALNIDSLTENMKTGTVNNAACLSSVGIEPVNFAFITKSGVAHAPANPVDSTLATFTPNPSTDLFMGSGDVLTVDMHDTADGFQVVIHDLTTGQSGSMTASIANQFGQVKFDPSGTTCQNIPYAFHPQYSTTSENTRVVWAAHSYNVAFSDEIGHFEYCNGVDPNTLGCNNAGSNDGAGRDSDDGFCFSQAQSLLVKVSGCLGTDVDFDGVGYQKVWPGSNAARDAAGMNPSPITFTSPTFTNSSTSATGQNYSRVAFETDLPRIEIGSLSPNNTCNRTTGVGCVNPPNGANFYPIYSTNTVGGQCVWELGGAGIPGATNTFGGTSTAEYGPLLSLIYPTTTGTISRFNNFRNVLGSNPCNA